jgi:hypothetical protein
MISVQVENSIPTSIDSIPVNHYFVGKIGSIAGLFVKDCKERVTCLEDVTQNFRHDAEIEGYLPVKGLNIATKERDYTIQDVPAGTFFTGTTCYVTGIFLKLSDDRLLLLDPKDLSAITTWAGAVRKTKIKNYTPVDVSLKVEV